MHRVFFYKTASGNSVVKNWLKSFSKDDRYILGQDLKTVQFGFPIGPPLCRPLVGGLWEIRSTLTGRVEARLVFYFDSKNQALAVLHGFIKKSQKTPKADIDLALSRKREANL